MNNKNIHKFKKLKKGIIQSNRIADYFESGKSGVKFGNIALHLLHFFPFLETICFF